MEPPQFGACFHTKQAWVCRQPVCTSTKMKSPLILFSAVVMLMFSSCLVPLPIVGGGIAGAGYDSVWACKAAENYKDYQDPLLTITRQTGTDRNTHPTFDAMFDDFPQHVLIDQDSTGRLGDLQISFRRRHLTINRGATSLINEQLPSVFYMHCLQVARFQAAGHDLVLFLSRSRATTGLSFIGLYCTSGRRLWTATVPSKDARNCARTPNGITFAGVSSRTNIYLRQ